jgi:hypothetical protein
MYSISKTGILKKLETWELIIPLFDNSKNKFPQTKIDEILENIAATFPGYTIVNCTGVWKDQTQAYKDENLQVIIDTLPSESADTSAFFSSLKDELCQTLGQEKIYVKKTGENEELISFNEFFSELGLELETSKNSVEENLILAQQLVANHDFIIKRLAYETVVLQRDLTNKKIIWERKICGIRLRTEFEDNFSPDIILCGADQLNQLGNAIFQDKEFVIIGDYEYQKFFLEKVGYKPIVEATLGNVKNDIAFTDQQGNPITTKKFIELFSMTVFSNYMVLREENFQSQEIKINVGQDGSMQIGENEINGKYLFHCPAVIKNKAVQELVIDCLNKAIQQYENNQLDTIALLQTKARTHYVKNRSMVRNIINNRN